MNPVIAFALAIFGFLVYAAGFVAFVDRIDVRTEGGRFAWAVGTFIKAIGPFVWPLALVFIHVWHGLTIIYRELMP